MTDLQNVAEVMRDQVARRLVADARVFWTGETGSTNSDARTAALAGQEAVAVFGAEKQSSGRGRLGRRWSSSPSQAVEMSFLFRPRIAGRILAGFNFAAALGICAGLEAYGVRPEVKWPNDVLVDGTKICGILSEACLIGGDASFVVTGTGINVNQTQFPPELGGATSLRILTGRPKARAGVAASCIDGVIAATERFVHHGFAGIMDEYRSRSAVLGQQVAVLGRQGALAGRCVDFDEDGAIVVEIGGERRRFHAGDVSLRGAGLHV